MARVIDISNKWDPPSPEPGTPWDQIKLRDPPGTGRTFKRLDALAESITSRLRADLDSLPTLRSLTLSWYNLEPGSEGNLYVETGVNLNYGYRQHVDTHEGKYVLPPLGAVRSDITDVCAEIAPALFTQYPQVERLEIALEVGTVVAIRVVMTRAALQVLGDKHSLYLQAAVGQVPGLPIDATTGLPSFQCAPNEYLVKTHKWQ